MLDADRFGPVGSRGGETGGGEAAAPGGEADPSVDPQNGQSARPSIRNAWQFRHTWGTPPLTRHLHRRPAHQSATFDAM
jgi:hypothetical protein